MVCLLRELVKEHPLLCIEMVYLGCAWHLSGFRAFGRGFVFVQVNE